MIYLAHRAIAPPGQEGWLRHQEEVAIATLVAADGVVVPTIDAKTENPKRTLR